MLWGFAKLISAILITKCIDERKMKKKFSVLLIAVLVGATLAFVYFSEPNIHYYSYSIWTEYKRIGDKWYTVDLQDNSTIAGMFTKINCENNGLFYGSFVVTLELTNAAFTGNYGQSLSNDNTILKVSYNLGPQEQNITSIYFSVNENARAFTLTVSLHPNQPFMRYSEDNWAGQSQFPYKLDNSNSTWASLAIS